MMAHKRLLTLLLISVTLVTGNDVTLGSNEEGKNIFEERFEGSPAIWKQTQNVVVNTTDDEVISKIVVTDHRPDKDGEVKIIDGGIGIRDVTIELSSPTVLRGYNFTVTVYSMPKAKYDHETVSKKPVNGLKDQDIPQQGELTPENESDKLNTNLDSATEAPASIGIDEENLRMARDTTKESTVTTQKPNSPSRKLGNESKDDIKDKTIDFRSQNVTSNETEKTTEQTRFYRDVHAADAVKENSDATTIKPPSNPIILTKKNKSLSGALKTELDKTKTIHDKLNTTLYGASEQPTVEPKDEDKPRDASDTGKFESTSTSTTPKSVNLPAKLPKEGNVDAKVVNLDARNLNTTLNETEILTTEQQRFIRSADTTEATTKTTNTDETQTANKTKVDQIKSRSLNSTNATTSNTTGQSTDHPRAVRDTQDLKADGDLPAPKDPIDKNEGRKLTPKPVALPAANKDSIVTTKPLILPTEVKTTAPNVPAIYEDQNDGKDDFPALEQLKNSLNTPKVNIPFAAGVENGKNPSDIAKEDDNKTNSKRNDNAGETAFNQLKDSLNTPKLNIPFTQAAKDKKPVDATDGREKDTKKGILPETLEKENEGEKVVKTKITRDVKGVEGTEKVPIPDIPRNGSELDSTKEAEEVETRSNVEETTAVPLKDEEFHPAKKNLTAKDIDVAKPLH